MSKNYDNWERVVRAVLRRQHDREIAMSHSRDASSIISSNNSSFNSSTSRFDDHSSLGGGETSEIPMDYSDLTLHHSGWKAMLPPDKQEVVWRSSSLSFFLDQRTGKNCFLFGAAKVLPGYYWVMKSHPKSRFSEVAELERLREIDVRGRIKTSMLSSDTLYAAYLVFGLTENTSDIQSATSMIRFFHDESDYECFRAQAKTVHFHPDNKRSNRADGWMEAELGDFYVGEEDNQEVEVSLPWSRSGPENCGLIVEGIEFRPVVKTIQEGKRNKRGKGVFLNFKISK